MGNLPEYGRWEDVPETLKTKTGLTKMGLRLAKGQKPAARKTHWDESIPTYDLYDTTQAIPKKVSEAQKEAATRAREASVKKRTCQRCGFVEELGRHYRYKIYVTDGLCGHCRERDARMAHVQAAIEWAKETVARPAHTVLILDTETTGLHGEIIELAIIDLAGDVKFNGRFKPIEEIEEGATAVHGITADMLANEPTWSERYEGTKAILEAAELVIIYNAEFDVNRLSHTCRIHGVKGIKFKHECLMEWYAQYVNEWSDYWGDYKWQPLHGGHSALSDCQAALARLRGMAGIFEPA